MGLSRRRSLPRFLGSRTRRGRPTDLLSANPGDRESGSAGHRLKRTVGTSCGRITAPTDMALHSGEMFMGGVKLEIGGHQVGGGGKGLFAVVLCVLVAGAFWPDKL
jgi:hypothetical protein